MTGGGDVVLTVLRGNPTPAQLAALVVVLTARSRPGPTAQTTGLTAWRDRRAGLRTPLAPGAGAWRASGLPG